MTIVSRPIQLIVPIAKTMLHIQAQQILCVCIHFLQVLTIAVLAIVLTAPLGAIAVSLLGPVLLTKTEEEVESETEEPQTQEPQSQESGHITSSTKGLLCTVKDY